MLIVVITHCNYGIEGGFDQLIGCHKPEDRVYLILWKHQKLLISYMKICVAVQYLGRSSTITHQGHPNLMLSLLSHLQS